MGAKFSSREAYPILGRQARLEVALAQGSLGGIVSSPEGQLDLQGA